jgi:hypothetical protein
MTCEIIYLVKAFKTGKGARLGAGTPPIGCKLLDTAGRMAETLAPTKAGVVAFATSSDAELGEYDEELMIIFKSGRLPAPFDEAWGRRKVMHNGPPSLSSLSVCARRQAS